MPLPDFDTLKRVDTPDFDTLRPVTKTGTNPPASPPHDEEADSSATPDPVPSNRPTVNIKLNPYEESFLKTGLRDPERVGEGAFTAELSQHLTSDVSNLARGITADIAAGFRALGTGAKEASEFSGNIVAALHREPLPIDKVLKDISGESPATATIGKISQGIAATAPMLALGALPKALQTAALIGFTGKMLADAPEVARSLGDELGKPKDQQNPDRISSLVSEAIQITGFSIAGGFAMGTKLGAKLGTDPALAAKSEAIKPVAPLTAQAVKEVAATPIPVETPKEKGSTDALQPKTAQSVRDVQSQSGEVKGEVSIPKRSVPPDERGSETPATQTPAKIVAAAYKPTEEGPPETGANHPEILNRLGIQDFPTRESRNIPQFGFVDEEGKFLTRPEAAERAKATGQQMEAFDVDEKGVEQAHSNEIASTTEPDKPISEATPPKEIGQHLVGEIQRTMDELGKLKADSIRHSEDLQGTPSSPESVGNLAQRRYLEGHLDALRALYEAWQNHLAGEPLDITTWADETIRQITGEKGSTGKTPDPGGESPETKPVKPSGKVQRSAPAAIPEQLKASPEPASPQSVAGKEGETAGAESKAGLEKKLPSSSESGRVSPAAPETITGGSGAERTTQERTGSAIPAEERLSSRSAADISQDLKEAKSKDRILGKQIDSLTKLGESKKSTVLQSERSENQKRIADLEKESADKRAELTRKRLDRGARVSRSERERPWDLIDELEGSLGGHISLKAARKLIEDFKPIGAARKLFAQEGYAPDVAHQVVSGFKDYGSDVAFLEALNETGTARKTWREKFYQNEKIVKEEESQHKAFTRDAKHPGPASDVILPETLFPGDEISIYGTKLKVKTFSFDDNGDVSSVELEDGKKYGTQHVAAGTKLFIDEKTLKRTEAKTDFASKESIPPKLRPGEKAGEMFQGEDQPFNLSGEKGIDAERIASEKAVAEKQRLEAAELAAKQQQTLIGTEQTHAERAKALADQIRARFKTPTEGKTFTGPVQLINAAAEIAAQVVEAGGKLADAIEAGIKYLRDNYKGADYAKEINEQDFINRFSDFKDITAPGLVEEVTSIKNAERQALLKSHELAIEGDSPAQAQQQWIDEANRLSKADPEWTRDLVQSLTDKPRAVTPVETAGLQIYLRETENAYHDTSERLLDALKSGDVSVADSARLQLERLEQRLQEIDQAGKRSGEEWSRTGTARQSLLRRDYSLATLTRRAMVDKGVTTLTDSERALIAEQAKTIADTQAALDRHIEESRRKLSEAEAARVLAEAKAEAFKNLPSPYVIKLAEKIGSNLKTQADAARERIKTRLGTVTFGSGPLHELPNIKDYAIIGAEHIYSVGLDIVKWGEKMRSEFGDKILPHLPELFKESQKLVEASTIIHTPDKSKRKAVSETVTKVKSPEAVVEATKAKITGRVEKGEMDAIHPLAKDIARAIIARDNLGEKDLDKLLDTLHPILQEVIPDITREGTRDALSGIGIFKMPSADQVSKTLADLRQQSLLLGQAERIEQRKPIPPTGPQRQGMSDTARRILQKVQELKRRFGVNVASPEIQLRSSLQAREKYYENRLSDLRAEIKAGELTVKTKSPSPTSEKLEALKAEYETVKQEHSEIFKKPELTDEQRLKLAIGAAERNEASWNKRLEDAKKGIFESTDPKRKVTSKELEAIKARTEAVREATNELRDLDTAYQELQHRKGLERQRDALEKSIANKEKQIAEGPQPPEGKPVSRPADPLLEELIQKREALNKELAESRKKPAGQKYTEQLQRRLEAIQKSIKEKESKIATGDLSPESSAKVNRPLNPELEVEQQKLDALNKQIQELRHPKKTPAQIALQSLKTRLKSSTADLLERRANKDFESRPRKAITLDPDATQLKAENNKAREAFERDRLKDRMANRSKVDRLRDYLFRLRRFNILSGLRSIEKLASYSLQKLALRPLLEEPIATVLGKLPITKEAFERSPFHASVRLRAELNYLKSAFMKGVRQDLVQVFKHGESDLAAALDPHLIKDKEWTGFFGRLHLMEKSPLIRASFERASERSFDWHEKHGFDVADLDIQHRIKVEAYQEALNEALVNPNWLSKRVNRFIQSLEEKDKATGRPRTSAKVLSTIIQYKLPIRNVPINYLGRATEYIVGSATGLGKLALAFRRGIETLEPSEANAIARHLTRGSVGAVVMGIGYLNPDIFGGYYQPGEKRKKGDVKALSLRIYGVNVPHFLIHNPLVEAAQFGATIRRIADSKLRKKDRDTQGIGPGLKGAMLGLLDEAPYTRSMLDYSKLRDPRQGETVIGNELRSALVPELLQNIAEMTDKDESGEPIKRKPRTYLESIELGIPGLRQQLPAK